MEIKSNEKKNLLNREGVIKNNVNMEKSKNTFGFILKKTDNKFIQNSIQEQKK